MNTIHADLTLTQIGINTSKTAIIYMREDCHICRSEGFVAEARVQITLNNRTIIATINTTNITSNLLKPGEASLSSYAWDLLVAKVGDKISIAHPKPLDSLSSIRSKLYGHELKTKEINHIVADVVSGQLSDVQIAMFLAGGAGSRFNTNEILDLTKAMVQTGKQLHWPSPFIVDKHCVGGLPGNRTTLIVVPIVAAFGLMMPKTSSRAITSPAGTADTMEVFAPVNLDIKTLQKVVEQEHGCIAWGGAVALSPADDLLIRIERSIDLDSEGQMVASILSKKIAAGSTHIVIDIPIGPTAKVRTMEQATALKNTLERIAKEFSIQLNSVFTDGTQPVGRGIGPALEARDVFSVLSCHPSAPQDLRDRALTLAGHLLEFSSKVTPGSGKQLAESLLNSRKALTKFEAICQAQGGFFDIPSAPYTQTIVSNQAGTVTNIDNRLIARLAKLAGAPKSKVAGVELLTPLNTMVEKGQPLLIVHAETQGELDYALTFHRQGHPVIDIEEST
ncbi:thymidine phosphorylase family protein [Legionella waltersii]|uniref:Putative thymidine phosphorylase n=1 Tax=Legionella waltersii TaxID=66969 RepID=A0A0W1AMQ8_9GAMM|nr:thymidine phosphorylase family protein [Legionella waltersii]KTD82544.1 thymidine phosphorylase [Legionella waltersii]OJX91897.1 MAG: thymidine phosphorylase [Legionella sp. 40-6]SNU95209.1 putative thymidine phosphorylase (TdRPase) [Legionella waltersii]